MRRIKPEEWPSLIDRTVLTVALTVVYLIARDSLHDGEAIIAHLTFWLAIGTSGVATLLRSTRDRREAVR